MRLTESILRNLNEKIKGGHKVSITGVDGPEFEKVVYKDYYVLLTNPSTGKIFDCKEFDSLDEAKDWAQRQVSYNGFDAEVTETESDTLINYYDSGDMGSDDEESSDERFTMKNMDSGEEVDVYKSEEDDKWYDSDGNRYMGYLSKQDVKYYFKGNWREV